MFAREAASRHGLRISFILEGRRWQIADAAEIVAMALRIIGARRPTWYQGQPAYTEEGYSPRLRTHCRRCRKPVQNQFTAQGLELSFCSNACRVATRRNVDQRTPTDYEAALRAAGELKRIERMTTCPNCGVEFVPAKWAPDPTKPRYCSNRCSKHHYFVKLRQARLTDAFTCEAAD